MAQQEIPRRLATIVAIDAAGYSRQSEIDEAVAVQEIGALGERIAAGAAAHGGRIFNTAGDGFMLEFASVSSAVACVDELLSNARVPLRVGMHVDEVAATPTGDLLGVGVNVASRLQALAAPGELIVSADVHRALHGRMAQRLQPRGAVKLDKMNLRVETYVLSSPWQQRLDRSRRLQSAFAARPWLAVGAVLVVLAIAIGVFFTRSANQALSQPTVAVLPFEALNADADAQFYADGVATSITNALSGVGVPLVSQSRSFQYRGAARPDAARALGATYLIDGDVRREGASVRISVRVEDARRGVTVLAKTFEGPADDLNRLRDQIAADIAGALAWGGSESGVAWRNSPGPEVTAAMFRIREQQNAEDRIGAYETARSMAQAAPRNAMAQAALGIQSAIAMRAIAPEDRLDAVHAGRAAAERAARLDSGLGEAHIAQSVLTPGIEWARREALLRRAIEVDPEGASAPGFLSFLLRSSGRLRGAKSQIARASAADPLSPNNVGEHIDVLSALGRRTEAQRLLDRAERLWPENHEIIYARFDAAILDGDWDQAQAMLRDRTAGEVLNPRGATNALESVVRALRTETASDTAAMVAACADGAAITRHDARNCMIGLTVLGELDAAFALASHMYPDQRGNTPSAVERRWLETAASVHASGVLFLTQTAPLRADPRFAGIAERLGLVAYWRESARGPDFCETEAAPVCASLAR